MAQNKFIFADRHGLICRIKPVSKDIPKLQETRRIRTSSVSETITDKESLDNNYSIDNALSTSFESLYHVSCNEVKKSESFFDGIFNDNTNCIHQKKTVTIMEPNGHKVYPIKLIKKNKIVDGNKKILECHLKFESFFDLSSSNLSQLSRSISKLVNLTQLYIYSNKISKLPKEIGNLINLKELWMQENNIDQLPMEMKNCKLLQHLDIRHNHLNDESLLVLTHFSNLKILLITHNKFTRMDGLGRLKKLETLSVKSNMLKGAITKSLGKIQNIVSLDLSKNRIISIPEELGNCSKLKRLNLEYNKIIRLPETIGNLKELEFIGIKYNQLEQIPETLNECILLKELNVESNLIEELPSSIIPKLHQMITLNISRNKFINLPKFPISAIEKVNAEYNNITKLSGALVEVRNLKILNLCYNNLSELQSFDIQNMWTLVDLNLAFNQLNELPQDICRLTHLESLDLTNNILSTTPKEIGQLKNLKFLNLESNVLDSLPDEFGHLEKLKNLNISSNQLKIFPKCLVQLKNLEMLNISENLITELPKSINSLEKLTHLFLKDNSELNNLPLTLAAMKNLNFLSLNGCPLKDIPSEYTKGPTMVIAYLKALEIGLRLQEYLKRSHEKFSSDTSLNIFNEQSTATSNIMRTNEKSSSSNKVKQNQSTKYCNIRPRSMSATSSSKKEHVEKLEDGKTITQKLNISDSLIKKMKTTEAGFLACSRAIPSKK